MPCNSTEVSNADTAIDLACPPNENLGPSWANYLAGGWAFYDDNMTWGVTNIDENNSTCDNMIPGIPMNPR
jgi:hypothetical protein